MAISDKLQQLLDIKQDIKEAIETKGIPMTDVAFTEYANKILDISGGGGGDFPTISYDEIEHFGWSYYIFSQSNVIEQIPQAWEHSLTVNPLEISEGSSEFSPRGKAQYPNGETEGVIIPQGVTSIGGYAFYNWSSNNQPLVIPSSVTNISWNAFAGWESNNQPLIIPNSVTSIGTYAFYSWSSNNQRLIIPNSVTSIGTYAFFYWTSNNQRLIIPNSVTSIENSAFSLWTSNNQPLVIPNSLTSIGQSTFTGWSSNNQPLVIPNSVTSIGDNAFRDWSSNNQRLIIPNSVTSIGTQAFYNWSSNNQPLVIPNSVTSIGNNAFGAWSLVPYVEIQAITPPTLASAWAFGNQNEAPIYVPDESVDAYKTAPNWVDLADRIFSINDKE